VHRVRFISLFALVVLTSLALAGVAMADEGTNAGGDLRNGWYPDESGITPQLVTGGTFGQLWSASVNGQVYAQPLLSASGTLIVATENDKVYGLDPATGAQRWTDDLGTPWNPADVGCADITPSIGTTATPVIDPSTNTVYLTHKTYVSGSTGPAEWFMDALNIDTGQEQHGFPVELQGTATNHSVAFDATDEQQRPGLLLMNGVVYAGFGGHCDHAPYLGWVMGVATGQNTGQSAGQITARWVDNAPSTTGGGIWQSGVGLLSDGSGSILLTTGNGGAPTTATPGSSPPVGLGEAVVRLHVQPDGSVTPVDFFAPFDAQQLDNYDADFGAGGVVGLPPAYFGTAAIPHLAVADGKEGYVYLLNLDNLGGFDQGPDGGDDVVQRTGPRGGVWGRAGVWPGDGGYVYIPTSSGQSGGGLFDVYKYGLSGTGIPSLSLVASSSDVFGWGSGSPVITSDGTTSGSALVWEIWSSNRQGVGGQLRAYDPVPVGGVPHLVYSAPIGTATNYSVPGVGAGRLYVGTRGGTVLAFGSPVSQPLSGSGLSFPTTTMGSSSSAQNLTLTASRNLTLSSLGSSSSQFTLGTPSQALPATLTTGQTMSVPVTFSPTQTGVLGGQVNADTDAGNVSFSLSGTGQATSAQLDVSPPLVSLGGTSVGSQLSGTATFSNVGGTTLTISAVHLPGAPFSATGAPVAGDTIAPGRSITVDLAFNPTQVGSFTSSIGLDSDGGNQTIGISASAGTPGLLEFSSQSTDFGQVPVASTATRTFTITNAGGTSVTVTKSKPPFGGAFSATTSLPEGTTIAPGASVTEAVVFRPTTVGAAAGNWQINGDDSSGLHQLQFTGSGIVASSSSAPPPVSGGKPPVSAGTPLPKAFVPAVVPSVASVTTIRRSYITYTAMAPGSTTHFTLQRATGGRRSAHGCVRATARNRRDARCTRMVNISTFTHRDRAGTNRIRIAGQVPARKLVPGKYRLRAIITDAAGVKHTVYSWFRVIPAPRWGLFWASLAPPLERAVRLMP
jgi:hypothetical protein